MGTTEFLEQMSFHQAIKTLKRLETLHLVKNTFLSDLREFYELSHSSKHNKHETIEGLLKLIRSQIDGIISESREITDISCTVWSVCELMENIKIED